MIVKKYDKMRKSGLYTFYTSCIMTVALMIALGYAAYLILPYVLFMLSAVFISVSGMMLILLLGILDELVSIRNLKEMEMKLS